jgi:hypothetical protein
MEHCRNGPFKHFFLTESIEEHPAPAFGFMVIRPVALSKADVADDLADVAGKKTHSGYNEEYE